jgi:hypothetical protein
MKNKNASTFALPSLRAQTSFVRAEQKRFNRLESIHSQVHGIIENQRAEETRLQFLRFF